MINQLIDSLDPISAFTIISIEEDIGCKIDNYTKAQIATIINNGK